MAIARVYRLVPAEGQHDALAAVLAELVPLIRAAEGCRTVSLLAERGAPGFTLIHWWTDEAAHQAGVAGLPRELVMRMIAALPGLPEGRYLDEVARG